MNETDNYDNDTDGNYSSNGEMDDWLIYQYKYNRAFNESTYIIIIVMYGVLIVFGALGNTLVVRMQILLQNIA